MRELPRISRMAGDYRITNLSVHYDTAKTSDLISSIPLRITFEQPTDLSARKALFVATSNQKGEAVQKLEDNLLSILAANDEARCWSLVCISINGYGLRLQILDTKTTQLHEYQLKPGNTDVVLRIHALDHTGMSRQYVYHERTIRGQHFIAVKEPEFIKGGPSQNLSFSVDTRDGNSHVVSVESI